MTNKTRQASKLGPGKRWCLKASTAQRLPLFLLRVTGLPMLSLIFDAHAIGTCSLLTTHYPSSTWSQFPIFNLEPWRTGDSSPTGSQPFSTTQKSWRWVSVNGRINFMLSGWWLGACHHRCGARDCSSVVWQLGHYEMVIRILLPANELFQVERSLVKWGLCNVGTILGKVNRISKSSKQIIVY